MKTSIVNSSALLESGRMDAGFHIKMKSINDDGSLNRNKERFSKADVLEMLDLMPPALIKQASEAFVRGSVDSSFAIARALEEYPFEIFTVAVRDTNVISEMETMAIEAEKNASKIKKAKI